MVKYRIAQKGDKYQAQYHVGSFLFGFWYEFGWTTKKIACDQVAEWESKSDFNKQPVTIHKPEDICKNC